MSHLLTNLIKNRSESGNKAGKRRRNVRQFLEVLRLLALISIATVVYIHHVTIFERLGPSWDKFWKMLPLQKSDLF